MLLQLNKTNSSETETPFLDLHLCILDGFISCKLYDKRDDFDCFPYFDPGVPRRASYGVYNRNYFGSPECLAMLLT